MKTKFGDGKIVEGQNDVAGGNSDSKAQWRIGAAAHWLNALMRSNKVGGRLTTVGVGIRDFAIWIRGNGVFGNVEII